MHAHGDTDFQYIELTNREKYSSFKNGIGPGTIIGLEKLSSSIGS